MNAYAIPGIAHREIIGVKINDFKDYPEITKKVCEITKQKETDVTKRTRKRDIVFTRQICMSLARTKLNNVSLQAIGDYYGGFDHATVMHSIRTVKNLIDTDKKIRADIGHLFDGVNWPVIK